MERIPLSDRQRHKLEQLIRQRQNIDARIDDVVDLIADAHDIEQGVDIQLLPNGDLAVRTEEDEAEADVG